MTAETVFVAAAGGGCILTLLQLLRIVLGAWKRIDSFLEDWNGVPARGGLPAMPSMPERMLTVEAGLAHVTAQVTPNGGNTQRLGDRIVRIENKLEAHHQEPNKEDTA